MNDDSKAAKRKEFCDRLIKVLNTFWLSFDGKKVEELNLASNSEKNIDILKQILDAPNRRSLMDGIGAIYDEICDVEEEEEESDQIANELEHEDDDDYDGKDDMKDGEMIKETSIVPVVNTAAAWLKKNTKKKKDMTFEQQLFEYFIRLTNESNVKPNLPTFFAIIFVQIGLYWKLRPKMLTALKSEEEKKLIEDVEKYTKMEMVDLSICDEYGQTLFHLAASLDTTKVFDILLEGDRDVVKYRNKLGKSAREEAIKAGQWEIVQNIALSQMGSRKKNKAKTEENRIESQHAIVKNFLKERHAMVITSSAVVTTTTKAEGQKEKTQETQETVTTKTTNSLQARLTSENEKTRDKTTSEQDKLLEELLQTQLNLLLKKLPLSDDILLLCWKYEMSINPSGDTNRLWLSLSTIIEEVLDNANNKRDWFWFKTYILQSIVEYLVCFLFCVVLCFVIVVLILHAFCFGCWTQIWYEYVTFAKSVADDAAKKNSAEEQTGVSGAGGTSKSEFVVLCDCGIPLELRYAKAGVTCSDCKEKVIAATSFLYECAKGVNSILHRNGFKICYECGEKRWKKLKEKRKKEEKDDETKENNDATGQGGTLFNNLYTMADERLIEQKEFLKSKIDPLAADPSWKEMIKYEQAKEDRIAKKEGEELLLRQDDEEHLTFPNKLGFDIKKIEELKLKDFYDSKVYLSNLMVVANALDGVFHDTMQKQVLKLDFHVNYKRGPIKTMRRCQAKAESDYASRKYPISSCVLG